MKVIAIAAIAVALGVPAASNANQDHTIVVENTPTVAQWTNSVGANLDSNLRRFAPADTGVVAVRFRCSEDGRPTAITLSKRSSSGALNYVAQRTVKNLKSLHPLPHGISEDQVYEANIIVADSQRDVDREIRDLQETRIAKARAENVLAFVVAGSAAARS